jgi:hypothetical protein
MHLYRHKILPDEQPQIEEAFRHYADGHSIDLVVAVGGTGFAPRDVTPEAIRAVAERLTPGLDEAMRILLGTSPRKPCSRVPPVASAKAHSSSHCPAPNAPPPKTSPPSFPPSPTASPSCAAIPPTADDLQRQPHQPDSGAPPNIRSFDFSKVIEAWQILRIHRYQPLTLLLI